MNSNMNSLLGKSAARLAFARAGMIAALLMAVLAGCSSPPPAPSPAPSAPPVSMTYPALNGSSRWVASSWDELQGFEQDDIGIVLITQLLGEMCPGLLVKLKKEHPHPQEHSFSSLLLYIYA